MKTRMGWPGADDPAYKHELELLAEECRGFLAAMEADDFDMALFNAGRLTAQCAAVYKLSPPAGLVDYPAMFEREEERK